ncbi:DUF3177 family protein [Pleurocapsales cyanobacterium LEGE 06147]|nr:DUF3177 family protein [Pleurocapsales cyanobacterium LEGE 06147]
MNEIWFRPLVWADYRLAALFLVGMPLVLLVWAVARRKEAIQKLLIIYWRVASLLMITVYLMIPGWRISFITAIAGRILIPIALWFWVDLNEEIKDLPKSSLKLVFTSWRWATTIYCIIGVAATIPFISCAFSEITLATSSCQVWLEAPQLYRQNFHPDPGNEGFLGFLGMVGLTIYVLYLAYFVLVRLGKQGRSALQ